MSFMQAAYDDWVCMVSAGEVFEGRDGRHSLVRRRGEERRVGGGYGREQ